MFTSWLSVVGLSLVNGLGSAPVFRSPQWSSPLTSELMTPARTLGFPAFNSDAFDLAACASALEAGVNKPEKHSAWYRLLCCAAAVN